MTGPAWIFLTSTIVLAIFCQFYKGRAEIFAEEVLEAHDWVDQIIEALEDPDVDQGDRNLRRLRDVRSGVHDVGDSSGD